MQGRALMTLAAKAPQAKGWVIAYRSSESVMGCDALHLASVASSPTTTCTKSDSSKVLVGELSSFHLSFCEGRVVGN